MIVTKIVKRVDLPDEPGEWVEIHPVSFAAMQAARSAKAKESLKALEGLTPEMLAALPSSAGRDVDPLDSLDLNILLEHCVTKWSYEEELNAENLALLDDATSQFLANAILNLKPEAGKS